MQRLRNGSSLSLGARQRAAARLHDRRDPGKQGWRERLRGSILFKDVREIMGANPILGDELIDEIETSLITSDVGVTASREIADKLRRRTSKREFANADALLAGLRGELIDLLRPIAVPLKIDTTAKPFVILTVGVNGVGKTTTIGKLARRLGESGHSVMLAAGDTFRAAAMEQLQVWADRSGAAFAAQQAGADPGAVIFDALKAARSRGTDVLLADTAGRLHSQSHLMEELKKVRRVIQRVDPTAPHEVLLVLDANQGQNALSQAIQFHEAVGVTGLVITKLDGTAKGGIVVAIARKLRLPIRFIGIGEGPEDFGEFDASAFAAALIGSGP